MRSKAQTTIGQAGLTLPKRDRAFERNSGRTDARFQNLPTSDDRTVAPSMTSRNTAGKINRYCGRSGEMWRTDGHSTVSSRAEPLRLTTSRPDLWTTVNAARRLNAPSITNIGGVERATITGEPCSFSRRARTE